MKCELFTDNGVTNSLTWTLGISAAGLQAGTCERMAGPSPSPSGAGRRPTPVRLPQRLLRQRSESQQWSPSTVVTKHVLRLHLFNHLGGETRASTAIKRETGAF